MTKTFLMLLVATISVNLKAQNGNITVNADARVVEVITLHKEHNKNYPLIKGYRIQLFKDSGNDALDAASDIMRKFKNDFPGTNVYLSFEEPYYRVRVGDYKTRVEALNSLEKIKRKYHNVWVIKDDIHF